MIAKVGKMGKWLALTLIIFMLVVFLPVQVFAFNAESWAKTVIFTIDKKNYLKGGKEIETDVAPYIKDGRTMVPVAFVAPALGTEKPEWLPDQEAVLIKRGNDQLFIKIGSNITADINATRLINLNFSTYTLTGNVSFATDASGSILISGSATPAISGVLTVNTPKATVTNGPRLAAK